MKQLCLSPKLLSHLKHLVLIKRNNYVRLSFNCVRLSGQDLSKFAHISSGYMKAKDDDKHLQSKPTGDGNKNEFPGYPSYPGSDDIFNKYLEEKAINPEDISEIKNLNAKATSPYLQYSNNELSGNDLDVPGSELDDEMEEIGSEDEENNYYSIGGDNHTDLDENNG